MRIAVTKIGIMAGLMGTVGLSAGQSHTGTVEGSRHPRGKIPLQLHLRSVLVLSGLLLLSAQQL